MVGHFARSGAQSLFGILGVVVDFSSFVAGQGVFEEGFYE